MTPNRSTGPASSRLTPAGKRPPRAPELALVMVAVATAVIAIATAGAPPLARAGSIEGQVTLAPWSGASTEASTNPYPGMAGTHAGAMDQHEAANDARDVVIYVAETGPAGSELASRRHPQLNQVGQAFVPRVLAIPVGTTVDFFNFDPVFHNVFSYSKAKRFDLGRYGKGKFRSVTFDQPGLVKVFCDIHANMAAFIYVVEGPLVVQPDENGNFQLRVVPPGMYAVRLWHPERGEKTVKVVVGDGVTHLDLSL